MLFHLHSATLVLLNQHDVMAKTFKNILTQTPQAIPDSKKDILDFFQEESEKSQTSVTLVTPMLDKGEEKVVESSIEESSDVRQTFVIGKDYLEKLKDFVHTQKLKGLYEYSQKNALHDALDLLFKDITITQRPESVIQKEQKRALRIRKGIGDRNAR